MNWPTADESGTILAAWVSAVAGLFAVAFIGTFAILALPMLLPPLATVSVAMLEIGTAAICVYFVTNALKLLSKRRGGYHEDGANPVYGTGIGQPALLGVSFAVAVIAVGYAGWWNHRLDSREYAHSKLCYAQLETADLTPRLNGNFVPGYLRNRAARYLSVAEEHGARLGMATNAMDRDLARSAAAYYDSYSALPGATAERRQRPLLDDVERCANDEWAAHGEIFNP